MRIPIDIPDYTITFAYRLFQHKQADIFETQDKFPNVPHDNFPSEQKGEKYFIY